MIPKQTGMITLGSPRLVIPIRFGVFWPNRAKKRRNGPLGSPGLSSQSVLRFSGQKGPKKPETDWNDKPGSPVSGFSGRNVPKTPKRTGVTALGSPGLSSLFVSGFFWPRIAKNTETDWDDNPGKPRLVIPIRFGVFWLKRATKVRNGLR